MFFYRYQRYFSLAILLVFPCWSPAGSSAPIVIKLGSLAPTGTPWHRVLEELDAEWREITDGLVQLRIYPGGVLGDEAEVVTKMRLGQIQAAGLTSKGLGDIDKGIWGLSLPLVIRTDEQLRWLHSHIKDELDRRYLEAGFVVVNWMHLGWVHWFSTEPIRTPSDLKQHRIFNWAGSANTERLWKEEGFQAVSLSVLDVLAGLQTGLIDALAVIPMTAAAYQWFGITNQMSDLRWANLTGAVIITRETWDRIPHKYYQPMLAASALLARELQAAVISLDKDAITAMQGYGLEVVPVTPEEYQQWEHTIGTLRHRLRGTLVDTTMYDLVMGLLEEMPAELQAENPGL